jgi:hypothetical protein
MGINANEGFIIDSESKKPARKYRSHLIIHQARIKQPAT